MGLFYNTPALVIIPQTRNRHRTILQCSGSQRSTPWQTSSKCHLGQVKTFLSSPENAIYNYPISFLWQYFMHKYYQYNFQIPYMVY